LKSFVIENCDSWSMCERWKVKKEKIRKMTVLRFPEKDCTVLRFPLISSLSSVTPHLCGSSSLPSLWYVASPGHQTEKWHQFVTKMRRRRGIIKGKNLSSKEVDCGDPTQVEQSMGKQVKYWSEFFKVLIFMVWSLTTLWRGIKNHRNEGNVN